jgi:glycyl-tRNA synthetase beta subunit
MARTYALIAPVQPVLHQISCINEILPNTPKHYETHQNMSLGSNGVDWVRSLQKILMRLHGTNFCINCTSSTRFTPSFV